MSLEEGVMTIKKMTIFLLLLIAGLDVSAQKYYISNLYTYDIFLMNPANAGIDKTCHSFGVFYQNQWLGMAESPTTQIITAQGPLHGNLGFGTYVYNDRNGNMKEQGFHQAFSYEVLLNNTRRSLMSLSFGLAVSLEQSSVDESSFDNNSALLDPVINGTKKSGWGYNTNAGVILKYNDYCLGYSVTNMLKQTNPLYAGVGEPELSMNIHVYLSSLYKIRNRDIFIEPIIMYRSNNASDNRMDLTLRATFPTPNPFYSTWGVLSYRRTMDNKLGSGLGMATSIGVNFKSVSLGVEYQFGLTGAQIEYGSAYQVVMRYTICNNLKHRAIPCSEKRKNKKSRYNTLAWY